MYDPSVTAAIHDAHLSTDLHVLSASATMSADTGPTTLGAGHFCCVVTRPDNDNTVTASASDR